LSCLLEKRIFPGVFFPELEGRHNVSGFILIKKNEGMQQHQKLEGAKIIKSELITLNLYIYSKSLVLISLENLNLLYS